MIPLLLHTLPESQAWHVLMHATASSAHARVHVLSSLDHVLSYLDTHPSQVMLVLANLSESTTDMPRLGQIPHLSPRISLLLSHADHHVAERARTLLQRLHSSTAYAHPRV